MAVKQTKQGRQSNTKKKVKESVKQSYGEKATDAYLTRLSRSSDSAQVSFFQASSPLGSSLVSPGVDPDDLALLHQLAMTPVHGVLPTRCWHLLQCGA